MSDSIRRASQERDLVCYKAMGMLQVLVEHDSIPPQHRDRAREILAEYKAATVIIDALQRVAA